MRPGKIDFGMSVSTIILITALILMFFVVRGDFAIP